MRKRSIPVARIFVTAPGRGLVLKFQLGPKPPYLSQGDSRRDVQLVFLEDRLHDPANDEGYSRMPKFLLPEFVPALPDTSR